jgi:protein-disulfide isomerase
LSNLSKPPGPEEHSLGPADAPITLVQYGSYDCPHCSKALIILGEVRKQYGSPLRLVYRHFPREVRNSVSERAAEAAEAAGAQGKFWQMHEHLLQNQHALDDASLVVYANYVGLNTAQFTKDLEAGTYQSVVRSQFQSGVESGVRSTPTFFINGVRHDDYWDADTLLEALKTASTARM